MTITEFITARLDEWEYMVRAANLGSPSARSLAEMLAASGFIAPMGSRVLATIAALREIVKLHENWPVLAETQPTFGPIVTEPDALINSISFRVSQQMAWLTEQEYRDKFGTEPPPAPMIQALAAIWADHDDYDEGWKP